LPAREELDFIARYARKVEGLAGTEGAAEVRGRSPVANVVDSTWRYARLTGYVRDLGSQEMPRLLQRVEADIDSIFKAGGRRPDIYVTGATRIFLKANDYLVDNLAWSLVATFLLIGLQMLLLFGSWRMMILSMVPNIVPLVVVAGLMGFLGMHIKPSTALIYELAFGITIDNSIHYLTAYRRSRRAGKPLAEGVDDAMRITGMGILYTSVVLLVGFSIFTLSSFGSTSALGVLTSITLFIAFFANLLFMPALLYTFDRKVYLKSDRALIDEDEP
jgi:predicted RND superfamily exporter protein